MAQINVLHAESDIKINQNTNLNCSEQAFRTFELKS